MPPGQWVKGVRSDPKGAMEADLVFLVVGVIGIVLGGLVTVAGVHTRQSTDNAGNPVLGNIMAALGLLVVVVSVILGVVNLVIWLTGRRRGKQPNGTSGCCGTYETRGRVLVRQSHLATSGSDVRPTRTGPDRLP
jgi:hypothetical protein